MTDHDEFIEDEEVVQAAQPPKRLRWSPPIEWNNRSYDNVVVRELNGTQILEVRKQQDPIAQVIKMIQLSSGIPPQVAGMLPQSVLEAGSIYFAGFSPASPGTGKE